jgi:3-deoxy-D-manno-octulosonate 8-phosphate phosphatase (KDO 8-P phosphatase)
LGCKNKTDAVKLLAEDMELHLEEIAFMGDDVNDYHAMSIVGYSACPSDAVDAIRSIADYNCQTKAGYGAVREFAEMILRTHEKTNLLTENW